MTVIETQQLPLKQGSPDLIQRNETQKEIKETILQLPTLEEVDTYFTAKQIPSSFKELTDALQPEQDITAKQVELYFEGKISEISGLKQDLKQRSKDYIDARMKVTNRANYSAQAEKLEKGEPVAETYFYKYQKSDAQVCLNKRIDSLITLITYQLNKVKQEVLFENFGKQDQYDCVKSQDLQTTLEHLHAFPNGRKNKRVSTELPPCPLLTEVVDAIYRSILSDLCKDSHGALHSGHLVGSFPIPKELDGGYLADIEELGNHTESEGVGGYSIDTEDIMADLDALADLENPALKIEGDELLRCLETLEE